MNVKFKFTRKLEKPSFLGRSKESRDWITPFAYGFALLTVGYAVAYYLLVRPTTILTQGGEWWALPDYHSLPAAVFEPLHKLDRNYFRPEKWSGSLPESAANESNSQGA